MAVSVVFLQHNLDLFMCLSSGIVKSVWSRTVGP